MRRNSCSSGVVCIAGEKLALRCEIRIICGRRPQLASCSALQGERRASIAHVRGWYDWWGPAKLPTLAATRCPPSTRSGLR